MVVVVLMYESVDVLGLWEGVDVCVLVKVLWVVFVVDDGGFDLKVFVCNWLYGSVDVVVVGVVNSEVMFVFDGGGMLMVVVINDSVDVL